MKTIETNSDGSLEDACDESFHISWEANNSHFSGSERNAFNTGLVVGSRDGTCVKIVNPGGDVHSFYMFYGRDLSESDVDDMLHGTPSYYMAVEVGIRSVIPWSNGGSPDQFGWVINGKSFTAADLADDPDLVQGLSDVAAEADYDDVVLFLQDNF